jgi:hypothetical protein
MRKSQNKFQINQSADVEAQDLSLLTAPNSRPQPEKLIADVGAQELTEN